MPEAFANRLTAGFMRICTGSVASGVMPFWAVRVMPYVLSVPGAGVPLITPVAGFNCRPAGKVPALTLTVGAGIPVRTGV